LHISQGAIEYPYYFAFSSAYDCQKTESETIRECSKMPGQSYPEALEG
jgi:hypothetical protein